MRLWRWFWGLRWWWKAPLGLVVVLVVLVAGYVGVRGIQYLRSGGDAGAYVPSGANVVVRAHDLVGHWARIEATPAWAGVRDRILGDKIVRRQINFFLDDHDLPTLDDLFDVRKAARTSPDLLFRAAGRDAVFAAQVGDTFGTAAWCAATKVGFLDFCLLPFAGLVLKSEPVGDGTAFRRKMGKREVWVSVQGALAVAGNSKELLARALKRSGRGEPGPHPLEARVTLGGSKALGMLPAKLRSWGLLPYVNSEAVEAITVTADMVGSGARLNVGLEGPDLVRAGAAAPVELGTWAPAGSTTGRIVTPAGAHDFHAWLRRTVQEAGPSRFGRDLGTLVETLEKAGLTDVLLPTLGGGMALLTGIDRDVKDGRYYPTLAMVIPSKDPQAAFKALDSMVIQIAKSQANSRFEREPLGEFELHYFEWFGSLGLNTFLQPAYVATKDALVLGNNRKFVAAVAQTGWGDGERFEDGDAMRAWRKRAKDHGLSSTPALAGGLLFTPDFVESLDGGFPKLAVWQVDGSTNTAKLRQEVEAELRRQGLAATEENVGPRFQAALKGMYEEREVGLRDGFRILSRINWVAWEVAPSPKGVTLKIVADVAARR